MTPVAVPHGPGAAPLTTVGAPQGPALTCPHTSLAICLGDNPAPWQSRLQTLVAPHTVEAEHVACAAATGPLLSLRRAHAEACPALPPPLDATPGAPMTFEGGQAVLTLVAASPPRLTP